ncbi:hypothetical protein GEMRC1_008247 [Eukaryota sp. GEM-RC1]
MTSTLHEIDHELLSEADTDSEIDFEITEEMAAKARMRHPEPEISTDKLEIALSKLSKISELTWVDTLSITAPDSVSTIIDADFNDDLKREVAFYNQALVSARLAKELCTEHNCHWQRPADYYAEMIKSDTHMEKIRSKMVHEKKRIEGAQRRRKEREQRKFGKQLQAQQGQQKAKERREAMTNVSEFTDAPDAGEKRRSDKRKPSNRPGKRSRQSLRLKGKNI